MPADRLARHAAGRGRARSRWDAGATCSTPAPTAREFVVEVETDGTATLRFGDDVLGLRPRRGTSFDASTASATARAGNVGAGALAHVVLDGPSPIAGVTNPLPAAGGVDPETAERVRQNAPAAFRTQERAVTLADYGDVAERHAGVQRAAASVRWTGSWPTVFVTVDRLGGRHGRRPVPRRAHAFLDGYRMAGQDVEVDGPQFASLDVAMFVCVKPRLLPHATSSAAARRLLERGRSPTGRRGFFHPDNFTFGQPVCLSTIFAAAQAVPGRRVGRRDEVPAAQGDDQSDARDSGVLRLSRLEIARLEQNPDFPEHGRLDDRPRRRASERLRLRLLRGPRRRDARDARRTRPGLPAIAVPRRDLRRVPRHDARRALLDGCAPPLQDLATRDDGRLLDRAPRRLGDRRRRAHLLRGARGERGYLRTATERVSLLQLARLIGYELRPGVAANAALAFTLETATGSARAGHRPRRHGGAERARPGRAAADVRDLRASSTRGPSGTRSARACCSRRRSPRRRSRCSSRASA